MTPGEDDLWFLPLGGTGEIGMNLNLYGHDGRWLMVDCGITFAGDGEPGPKVQMADPGFIADRREMLDGLVVTHAHEDHVGAVAHLWPRFRCTVYTTRFTATILERKLAEVGLSGQVPVKIVEPGARRDIGRFDVTWIGLTHSTPESQALLIRTRAGAVFHTGDWKLDADPVVGPPFDEATYRRVGDADVLAMVCDSTNALTDGRSATEGELFEALHDAVADCSRRVVVACFGSNVARLKTLVRVAQATNRRPGLLGRSLGNYYAAAQASGVWGSAAGFVDSRHLGYLPPEEVFAVATGSQGEPRAALDRLAADTHRDLLLEPGDTVILSSRVIPGNERVVARLVERLEDLGARVIQDGDAWLSGPIHASGHPARDELTAMYRWIRPSIAVPTHGEAAHLASHGKLARNLGIPRQLVGENGDLFMLAPHAGIRRGAASVGRLGLERDQLVPVTPVASQGRREARMA